MPPTKPKGGKMMTLINYRLRITLNDSRQLVGQLLAFDNHMNLVLADAQEFRKLKSKKAKAKAAAAAASKPDDRDETDDPHDDESHPLGAQPGAATQAPEQKRTLGMLILRGENIVSISIESPPPADTHKENAMAPGPGRPLPMGRGLGLPGPTPPGMGSLPPVPPMMARPMAYARPPPPPGMPGMPPPPGMPSGPPPGFAARPPPGFPSGPPPGAPPLGFPPGGFRGVPPPGFGMPPRPPQ